MAKKAERKKTCPGCGKSYGIAHRKKNNDYRCHLCGWEGALK